jgi:hypothetical protein
MRTICSEVDELDWAIPRGREIDEAKVEKEIYDKTALFVSAKLKGLISSALSSHQELNCQTVAGFLDVSVREYMYYLITGGCITMQELKQLSNELDGLVTVLSGHTIPRRKLSWPKATRLLKRLGFNEAYTSFEKELPDGRNMQVHIELREPCGYWEALISVWLDEGSERRHLHFGVYAIRSEAALISAMASAQIMSHRKVSEADEEHSTNLGATKRQCERQTRHGLLERILRLELWR